MLFSELVKTKRLKNKLSLAELEKIAGVSASFINRIENNVNRAPSAENVFKLSRALDISVKEVAECFNIKLKESKNEIKINVSKAEDYILIERALEVLMEIANSKKDFNKGSIEIQQILLELRKEKILLLAFKEYGRYVVEIKRDDKRVISTIKQLMEEVYDCDVCEISGELVSTLDEERFSVNDFIDIAIDCEAIDLEEANEFKNYLKEIKY